MSSSPRVLIGHGTENDFVLLPDHDGTVHGGLSPEAWSARVRALCDRRAGIGGDGVLRVVRGEDDHWFMDYWNADGSVSEMCGNGIRVFARHLVAEGLVPGDEPIPVQTRDGATLAAPSLFIAAGKHGFRGFAREPGEWQRGEFQERAAVT